MNLSTVYPKIGGKSTRKSGTESPSTPSQPTSSDGSNNTGDFGADFEEEETEPDPTEPETTCPELPEVDPTDTPLDQYVPTFAPDPGDDTQINDSGADFGNEDEEI